MQIDMQVSEAFANELVKNLNQSIHDRTNLQGIEVEIIKPLVGVMGVENIPTVRVKGSGLGTAAQIAAVLGLCLATYVGLIKEPQHEMCVINITTEQMTTQAEFPCRVDSQGLLDLLTKHVDKHGMPDKVQLKPKQLKK